MNQNTKYPAIAIFLGALLMFLTMVLHPVGGNLDHLRNISGLIKVSHGIAILSLPLTIYGYWGLTNLLRTEFKLAVLGFIFVSFGYVAVLNAAIFNGLVIPIFVDSVEASGNEMPVIDLILTYNFSINQAYDLIFLWAHCLAIIIWSVGMLKTKIFSQPSAYLGMIISVTFIGAVTMGFNLVDVVSLRYFMIAIICWSVVIAFQLLRK